MLERRDRWLALGACVVAVSCGVVGSSKSENAAQLRASLLLPPQISPDFAVDRDPVPDLNRNARLLDIAASAAGGYLLTYDVPSAPESWSRNIRLGSGLQGYGAEALVFVHWNALSGAATRIASVPISTYVDSARSVDIGASWLIAYRVANANHLVTLASDGALSSPNDLSGSCSLTGFAHGGDTALLTDGCGKGLLLDLAGNLLSSLTIATPDIISGFPSTIGSIVGGQVAFNGIDYLAVYGLLNFSSGGPKQVNGFPITTAGTPGPTFFISSGRVSYAPTGVVPISVVANGSSFLTLLRQGRSSGPGTDITYRTISESPTHTFAVSSERFLPGGPAVNPAFDPSDRQATALALNGHFATVREDSVGNVELIAPSTDPTVLDARTALGALPNASLATSLAASDGTRLILSAGGTAQRFDDTLHPIDVPAKVLVSAVHGQFMPSFAFSGQRYLAAWTEAIADVPGFSSNQRAPQIFSQHLSTVGTVLDATSTRLSAALSYDTDPLLTGNPSSFAGVWDDTISGSVDGAATLTTAEPPVLTTFPLPGNPFSKWSIATDGVHSAVAWVGSAGVQLAQFGSAGTWSSPLLVSSSAVYTPSPALAFNANQYAVLWSTDGNSNERVIYGARVSSGLTLLDSTPKELLHFAFPDSGSATPDCGVTLIASGDHFLLAWFEVVGAAEELRIARLSSTLTLLDPEGVLVATQPLSSIGFSERRVTVGWDGNYDWVFWRDGEGGASPNLASLRGRRFLDSLAPADSDSFLIAGDLDELSMVTLAVGDGGRSLVGYTRYQAGDVSSFRVRARFLSSAPFADGVPCSSAGQCSGGACVAGACSTLSGTGGQGGVAGGGGLTGGGNGGGDTSPAGAGNAGGAQSGDAGSGDAGEGGISSDSGGSSGVGGSSGGVHAGGASGRSGAGAGANGGSHGSSCSVRTVGARTSTSREGLGSLAGLIGALAWLRRRRERVASTRREGAPILLRCAPFRAGRRARSVTARSTRTSCHGSVRTHSRIWGFFAAR